MKRAHLTESALCSLAGDLMTSPVVAAAAAAPVREVARLMLDHGVGAVPVLDASGAAIGMASDGDLLRRRPDDGRRIWWLGMVADGFQSGDLSSLDGDRSARDVMTSPLISISPGTPVQDIAEALQAHRIKRVPVIEDGRLVGIVSRADLLCVVESVPKIRADEGAGVGLLSFLESLIGGMSLRGVLERPAALPPAPPAEAPAAQPGLSAAAFRAEVRAFKAETLDRQQLARREAELNRRRQIKALMDHHVSAQLWRELLDHAALAARSGEQELMLLRFPSDLCSDGGRKIDVAEKGWEDTLRGEAAEIYSRWRQELKPQGFRLSARVVSYEEGILGDLGLYLTWGA
jgi:CBS domain-containing protein